MIDIVVEEGRRAWLYAALVAVFGLSCAPGATPYQRADRGSQVRVETQWRLELATDRGWVIEERELGQPVLAPDGDLLVGATNGWAYRIKSHSGEIRWQVPVTGAIDAPAALASGVAVETPTGTTSRVAYVGTNDGHVVALDWRDGEELWRFETRGSIDGSPVVEDGRLFVTDSDDVLYAIDAVSGEFLWDYQREAPEFFTIKGGGEPLVVGERVYCGFADGHLVALHTDSGDEIWASNLGDDTEEFGDVDLPIFHDEERLIATSYAGGIFAVEEATGALLWHVDISDVSGLHREDDWLFGTTATGRVFALDLEEGDMIWEHRLPDGLSGMDVTLGGPFVVVAVADGPMYWLRVQDGALVNKWAPSSGFQNAPVFDERYGYVMSNGGVLYGIGLAF